MGTLADGWLPQTALGAGWNKGVDVVAGPGVDGGGREKQVEAGHDHEAAQEVPSQGPEKPLRDQSDEGKWGGPEGEGGGLTGDESNETQDF